MCMSMTRHVDFLTCTFLRVLSYVYFLTCTFLRVHLLTCVFLSLFFYFFCVSHSHTHMFSWREELCQYKTLLPWLVPVTRAQASAPWLLRRSPESRGREIIRGVIKHPARCLAPAAEFDLLRVAGWSVLSIKYLLTYSGSTYSRST